MDGASFGIGLGAEVAPVQAYTSATTAAVGDRRAYGVGPRVTLEVWPVRSSHLSLGLFGDVFLGGLPVSQGGDTVLTAHGGLKLEAGLDQVVALIVGYGFGYTSATTTSGIGAQDRPAVSGSSRYGFARADAGLRLCMVPDGARAYCRIALDLEVGVEEMDFVAKGAPLPLYASARLTVAHGLTLGLHLVTNEPVHPLANAGLPAPPRSLGLGVTVGRTWDVFGAPYLSGAGAGSPAAARRRLGYAYLGAGGLSLAGGLLVDLLPASGRDHALEPLDLVPLGLYAVSAILCASGVYLLW